MNNKVVNWFVRILMLDKIVQLFGKIRPAFLRPTVWLQTLRCLPPVTAFLAWRSRQSSFVRHLMGNMVVGLSIAVLLWNLHDFSWLKEIEDGGIDWVMRMQWGVQPMRPALPYAFIDIDEETYRDWGEPFHIPRDRLLHLIRNAVDGKASAVVVDVDLSQRGHNENADNQLKEYLADYDNPGRPPIILTRVFREPLKSDANPYRSVRRSFLEEDARIAQSKLIHWGSPLFNLDQDRVLRRWRLWEPNCTGGQPGIVPSIQLLTIVLLNSDRNGADQAASELQRSLAPFAPKQCGDESHGGSAHAGHPSSEIIEISGMKLHSSPDAIAQRIVYTQPWRLESWQARPTIPAGHGTETEAPILAMRSALPIFNPAVDNSWLSGRVVVIGASFSESRDRHLTPLGEMPGALVLINAIHSLQQYGELNDPPLYVKLLVDFLLIVVMSLAFAGFDSFLGMLVSGATIILALLPVSFVVFRYGVWLDFAIPLVAVQLHQMAEEFQEHRHRHEESPSPLNEQTIKPSRKIRARKTKHRK
ncbi:MAG: CHASE2 domain-containing protein [Gammaproteobacteria bacterium]